MDFIASNDMPPLPPEWQKWLRDNLNQGCDPLELAHILQQNGFAHCGIQIDADIVSSGHVEHKDVVSALFVRPQLCAQSNLIVIDKHPIQVAAILEQPHIILFHHLLSDLECDALCQMANNEFVPATVVDEADGSHQAHPHRSSEHACFARAQTQLIDNIEKRIAQLLNWPLENAEGMQILRYHLGGEYRAHFDYFDPQHSGSQNHLNQGGQRVGTLLMYLSDVQAGGGTRFPAINFEVRPQKGSAVYFANMDSTGVPDQQSLHASVPVISGVKYAATKWLREQAYG